MCSKITGGHPCRSAISIKLQSNFIEIRLRRRFSPVNFLHIFCFWIKLFFFLSYLTLKLLKKNAPVDTYNGNFITSTNDLENIFITNLLAH